MRRFFTLASPQARDYAAAMRRLFVIVALAGGCFAGTTGGGGGSRPGVMPMMSELPGDAEKRNGIIDSANQTPGPEMRKGQTKKEKKAETAAATAAAIIGSAFSTTQNVTIGSATTFDENQVVHPTPPQPAPRKDEGAAADTKVESGALVPWVKLPPKDAPAQPKP